MACGLIYTRELLPWETLVQKYAVGEFSPLHYYALTVPADLRTAEEELAVLRQHASPGRLLDIGCCMGTFMRSARAQGWQTHGIDINPASVAACQALGLSAETSLADELPVTAEKYDACHMGDVIEHLTDPVMTLRHIRALLRPGATLLVTTPNLENWAARLWQVKPGEHVLYFTRHTLQRMLETAGFTVRSVRPYDRHLYLPGLRQSSTFSHRPAHRLLLAAISLLFAGHQVVRLPLGEHLMAVAYA